MKILFVGPGLLPIPPEGWGGIEHLVWDMKLALNKLDHDVKIVNTTNPKEIIYEINTYRPDFVHVQYDDWILLYPYICLLYTSPSPRDLARSRMPSSA